MELPLPALLALLLPLAASLDTTFTLDFQGGGAPRPSLSLDLGTLFSSLGSNRPGPGTVPTGLGGNGQITSRPTINGRPPKYSQTAGQGILRLSLRPQASRRYRRPSSRGHRTPVAACPTYRPCRVRSGQCCRALAFRGRASCYGVYRC
jgi:hypothetical protein